MPTYEYECTQCARIFEMFQPITASPVRRIKTDCAKCKNSAPVKRLIGTGAALLFKGDGFYETDYRSDGYKKAAKAESESKSEKSKSDTSSDGKSADKKTDNKGDSATKNPKSESAKTGSPAAKKS